MYHVVAILLVQQEIKKYLDVVQEKINIQSKSNRIDSFFFNIIKTIEIFILFSSTPVISTVQPTCFKNISIFYSNSPYIIQKMGELVCVDYDRCLLYYLNYLFIKFSYKF